MCVKTNSPRDSFLGGFPLRIVGVEDGRGDLTGTCLKEATPEPERNCAQRSFAEGPMTDLFLA